MGELVDPISTLVNSPNLSVVDSSFVAAQAVACAAAGQIQQAKGALARLTGSGLEDLPSSGSWLAATTAMIEAAALLDDSAAAGRAYALLLPYAHLPVMASMGVACFGSAHHPLGVACLVTGDVDLAIEHLEAAAATTLSRHRLGEALSARGAPGDATAAQRLFTESAAEAAAFGMRLSPLAVWRRSGPHTSRWTRWGRGWRIEMAGRSVVVEEMVGMQHLATLVANPGTDIPAVELARIDRRGSALPETWQPVLDAEALRQYRTRMQELTEEIDEEEQIGGAERVAALQSEVDWILHEIQAATGLGVVSGGGPARSPTTPNVAASQSARPSAEPSLASVTRTRSSARSCARASRRGCAAATDRPAARAGRQLLRRRRPRWFLDPPGLDGCRS